MRKIISIYFFLLPVLFIFLGFMGCQTVPKISEGNNNITLSSDNDNTDNSNDSILRDTASKKEVSSPESILEAVESGNVHELEIFAENGMDIYELLESDIFSSFSSRKRRAEFIYKLEVILNEGSINLAAIAKRDVQKAFEMGKYENAENLILKGADPNQKFIFLTNKDNKYSDEYLSLLQWAAYVGDQRAADILLKYGARMDFETDPKQRKGKWDDCSPLMIASGIQHEAALVSFFISKGADPNATNVDGFTPLMYAAFIGRADYVRILIDAGADVNYLRDEGVSRLYLYSEGIPPLQAIRSWPMSVPIIYDGSALSMASYLGYEDIVRLLISNGVETNQIQYGLTALDLAREAEHKNIETLLLQAVQ